MITRNLILPSLQAALVVAALLAPSHVERALGRITDVRCGVECRGEMIRFNNDQYINGLWEECSRNQGLRCEDMADAMEQHYTPGL